MSRVLIAALLVSAAAAAAPSVEVTNTTANPVPVTVTNSVPVTGSVQVTNTPTVTVSGPVQVGGSVQVTNTPAVTINGTPTVTVANLPGSGTLYSEFFVVSTGATSGTTAGAQGTTVPVGKRRTINTVSASWTCNTGKRAQVLLFVGLPAGVVNNGSVFGGQGQVSVPGEFASNFLGSQDIYAGTHSLNLPLPPQGTVTPLVNTDANSNCNVTIWLFGVETADSP